MIFTLKVKIATAIGINLAMICLFYWGLYNPRTKIIERIEREIEGEKLRVVRLREKSNEYEEIKKEYEIMKSELSFLESQLIGRKEIPSFFSELSLRGKTYGIDYVKIVPEKIISGKYYDRVPVGIELYSTYHALGKFLSDIARRPRMSSLTVENIEMKGIESEKTSNLEGQSHTIGVNLLMFIYNKKDVSQKITVGREESQEGSLEANKGVKVEAQRERVESRRG